MATPMATLTKRYTFTIVCPVCDTSANVEHSLPEWVLRKLRLDIEQQQQKQHE